MTTFHRKLKNDRSTRDEMRERNAESSKSIWSALTRYHHWVRPIPTQSAQSYNFFREQNQRENWNKVNLNRIICWNIIHYWMGVWTKRFVCDDQFQLAVRPKHRKFVCVCMMYVQSICEYNCVSVCVPSPHFSVIQEIQFIRPVLVHVPNVEKPTRKIAWDFASTLSPSWMLQLLSSQSYPLLWPYASNAWGLSLLIG